MYKPYCKIAEAVAEHYWRGLPDSEERTEMVNTMVEELTDNSEFGPPSVHTKHETRQLFDEICQHLTDSPRD